MSGLNNIMKIKAPMPEDFTNDLQVKVSDKKGGILNDIEQSDVTKVIYPLVAFAIGMSAVAYTPSIEAMDYQNYIRHAEQEMTIDADAKVQLLNVNLKSIKYEFQNLGDVDNLQGQELADFKTKITEDMSHLSETDANYILVNGVMHDMMGDNNIENTGDAIIKTMEYVKESGNLSEDYNIQELANEVKRISYGFSVADSIGHPDDIMTPSEMDIQIYQDAKDIVSPDLQVAKNVKKTLDYKFKK